MLCFLFLLVVGCVTVVSCCFFLYGFYVMKLPFEALMKVVNHRFLVGCEVVKLYAGCGL